MISPRSTSRIGRSMRVFGAANGGRASREPKRLTAGRARSVSEPTVWGLKPERRAQGSDRHRGSGGAGDSAAEVELGSGLVGSSAGGGDDDLLGSNPEVVEDAAGDGRIGDEREHAQMITAARALGHLIAEDPA